MRALHKVAAVIINFEFSGGGGGIFARSPVSHTVSLDEPAEPDQAELVDLLRLSGLLAMFTPGLPETGAAMAESSAREETGPHTPAEPERVSISPGRGYSYRLTVSSADQELSFSWDDGAVPLAVRPLLRHLQRRALSARLVESGKPPAP